MGKSLRLNSFPMRCINEWNNQPDKIVCKTSVDSFKIALDMLWFHKRFLIPQQFTNFEKDI